jgi:Asp-tRNA(Asn)/Glu-tRNA(Gln) amidotransferase B subunit
MNKPHLIFKQIGAYVAIKNLSNPRNLREAVKYNISFQT